MSENLEEIKERQEQLERYVRLLEARVDAQESSMKFYNSGRKPATLPDAGDAPSTVLTSEEGLQLKGFDYLLRSILTRKKRS